MQRSTDNRPLIWTAVAAAGATLAITFVPFLRFAYDNPSLHVSLETGEGLIAILLAFLSFGRYRAAGRPGDLVLGAAFTILAATNLFLSVGPNVAAQDRAVGYTTWASAGLRLSGAVGIAIAAALGEREARIGRRRALVAGVVAVVVVLALAAVADGVLGDPIDPTVDATASNRPTLIGHPLLLALQATGVLVFGVAAVLFARRPRRRSLDEWLAAGCILAAFSRVHYFLFSSLYTSWVSTGDVLRLGSYLAFLAGAAFEIRAYWRAQSELAAADERGRIARDLHDGLAQELSFIRSQTIGASTLDSERATMVGEAAGRALLESRRLIRVLSSERAPVDEELRDAFAAAARAGVAVEVEIDGTGDTLAPALQAALIGIAREAGGNAVRHGRPTRVWATLVVDAGGRGSLEIGDDGNGFDPALPSDGFGLRSMRERAAAVGASLAVRSARRGGTVITVRW